ncbi:MAG TPA: pyrimidine dimer DNA glycosylase/endonuclease V [Phycisphaerae bacterium]|jgi:hypothetical protein|nr:pyrimidine dimer DNA glycosylase/endonuclease V [Phycisphaerae bacterium]
MRLWTVHPRYLDAQGLVAVWREGLLAQKVLGGGTRGYRHHPQLTRFRGTVDPVAAIAGYLAEVAEEAARRGYAFDARKISAARLAGLIDTTKGQLVYEWKHLRRKLRLRSPAVYRGCRSIKMPGAHPLFRIVAGGVEEWERAM